MSVYNTAGMERIKPIYRVPGAPFITSISPTTWSTGNNCEITVNGGNFTVDSVIRIEGVDVTPTTFNSTSQLTATISGASIASGATYDIDVEEPGVASSNLATLTVVADANYASVVLLIHAEGVDGSTTITDQKGHTMTSNNGAQLDTAQKKFGVSSLLLDGTNDYVTTPDSADWSMGSADFTIEAWVRFNSLTGNQCVMTQYDASSSQRAWLFLKNATTDILQFFFTTDGTTGTSQSVSTTNNNWVGGVPVAVNTWYHVAVTRISTNLRLFVNGTLVSTFNCGTTTMFNSNQPLNIGSRNGGGDAWWNGWQDEMRITKGVGRYSANFTPDPYPFPNSAS